MGRSALNVSLLILVAVVVGLTWTMRRDFTARNAEFLPGMLDAPRYDAQSANPNFADGSTMRPPVPSTIARGFAPLGFGPGPDEALKAGDRLRSPVNDTTEGALARGAVVFATYCQPCHGPGGMGDGRVAQRGFPPPPSLLAEKAIRMKDGQIFHIITHGQGNMPGLASMVRRKDRWNAVLAVRDLQRRSPATAEVPR